MKERIRSADRMPTAEGTSRQVDSGNQPEPLTVAIIEDQKDIRAGLQVLIKGSPGFRCVGACASIEEALAGSFSESPKLILVDIGLPGMSGTEGIPLLRQKYLGTICLVLTVYDDD